MTRALVLTALLTGLATDAPADAIKKEKERLAGTWKVATLEVNGRTVPAEAVKDLEYVFTSDTLTRRKGGKAESGSGYRLDPAQTPKWIDMTGTKDGKEVSVPGLYKLDGDALVLCLRADYKKKDGRPNEVQRRPTKLDGGAGSEQVLMTLERAKP